MLGGQRIADHVAERMVVVSHVWPGITPFNVMGLRLGMWRRYAAAADNWVKARQEG